MMFHGETPTRYQEPFDCARQETAIRHARIPTGLAVMVDRVEPRLIDSRDGVLEVAAFAQIIGGKV